MQQHVLPKRAQALAAASRCECAWCRPQTHQRTHTATSQLAIPVLSGLARCSKPPLLSDTQTARRWQGPRLQLVQLSPQSCDSPRPTHTTCVDHGHEWSAASTCRLDRSGPPRAAVRPFRHRPACSSAGLKAVHDQRVPQHPPRALRVWHQAVDPPGLRPLL